MPKSDFTFTAANGKTFTTDEHGFITGDVMMDASTLIDNDLEGALDAFSMGLTGSALLQDLSYKPVRLDGETIVFEVTGETSLLLENLGLYDGDDEEAAPSP